jgi:hypothetical protein
MENHGRTDGITTAFQRAITSNGEALSIYNAMLPAEQERFRRRCESARSREELKTMVDELVGWKVGHPPYEL